MTASIKFSGGTLAVLLLIANARPDDRQQEPDLRELQGDWKVVSLEADGRRAQADELKGMHWTFKGTRMQPTDPGEERGHACEVKIDRGQSPRHIDLTVLEGTLKGQTLKGIYKVEKERLTVCLRDEKAAAKGRPKEFNAGQGTDQGMIVLERTK